MKEKKASYIPHPRFAGGDTVLGIILGPGDTLEETDVYGSTMCKWPRCPNGAVGTVLKKT